MKRVGREIHDLTANIHAFDPESRRITNERRALQVNSFACAAIFGPTRPVNI